MIRYGFERGHVNGFAWLPGKVNLTDVGTKLDSPVEELFQLTVIDGKLAVDVETICEYVHSCQSLG